MNTSADVLVAGAGPTGLVLAYALARQGARVRIVDKTETAGTTSRALAVQARTLEFYRMFGFADEVAASGRHVEAVNLWVEGKRKAHAVFGELGRGLSPFPFALIFPQDEHEKLLIGKLRAVGVEVERQTEMVGFNDEGDRVTVQLRKHDGAIETCKASYLAGCDGAHSLVRQSLNIGFPGGTYAHTFYVADVEASGAVVNGELHVGLDRNEFLAVFPLKGEGRVRLVGTIREEEDARREQLKWEDVSHKVIEWMNIQVDRVNWFSTYRVHHRVADTFRVGRAFLLGDAGHIHSPVGGQGMNTGIGDAVNLAWKLAAVVRGRAKAEILDTYEPERIAFARKLVATTDKAFVAVTSASTSARLVRLDLTPAVLPSLLGLHTVRRLMFRTVSQTAIEYRDSSLSEGRAGGVWGGDRLPWVQFGGGDNFGPLQSLTWQVHVYGAASDAVRALCAERGLALHVFPWRSELGPIGLRENAVYLLRPDAYVGCVARNGDAAKIARYLDARGIVV